MISSEEILKKYWGFTEFRPPQKEIIEVLLAQNDAIVLLPTGGGKSVCFQVPALIQNGVCIVISPLIALMNDQVENLQKKNIKATTIPSGTHQNELITLFDNIKFGNYKFLYISPERLQSTFIQQKIKELNVNLIAVDEAHCISEWGHDFRPSYRNISLLRALKPTTNCVALTATANKRVLEDISENLTLQQPKIFKKSFFKPHLAHQIFNIEDKLERLLQIFIKTKKSAIIYTNLRKRTAEISTFLNANGFKSAYYHAGLSILEKQTAFDSWMTEKTPIIVATNAFGMGIDKPNVGLVIHFNLPSSIENYVQETGRAGRDKKKSFAVLLYNKHDILLFRELTKKSLPTIKEVKHTHRQLYQYFRIGNGELLEEAFHFNLLEFCSKYGFSVPKTDAILKILSNHRIIEIGNQYNQKSTLVFTANNATVLSFSKTNKSLKNYENILLRTYGGL
ncbi:MAG: RecQ family ATP-dependent DNA helicase, partial [Polaribacter sp.]